MQRLPGCGAGLAAHAPLPRQLAEVAMAMARLLEVHMRALDPGETEGRVEAGAYRSLSEKYARASEMLTEIAGEAESDRDLAAASHDMAFMTGPEPLEAFERLVIARRDLLELLQAGSGQDASMLESMRASRRG